ncbi:MAG: tetratricopeptide repeat-containing sensor histidine kinase [Nitritalea sp.]
MTLHPRPTAIVSLFLFLLLQAFQGLCATEAPDDDPTSTLDSLLLLLKAPLVDSVREDVHLAIFFELAFQDNTRALAHLDTCILLAEKENSNRSLGRFYNNQGVIHNVSGRMEQALKSFMKALEYTELANDTENHINILGNLSSIHLYKNQLNRARYYNQKVFELIDKDVDADVYMKTLNNLAIIAKKEGDFEDAFQAYTEIIDLAKKNGNTRSEANALNNLAIWYLDSGEPETALKLLEEALPLNLAIDDRIQQLLNHLNMGRVFLELQRPEEALAQSILAIDIAEDEGYKEEEALAYKLSADALQALERFSEAFLALQTYTERILTYKKEIYDSELMELQETFDFERQEQDISYLKEKESLQTALLDKRQNQIYLFIALLLLTITVLAIVYYLFAEKKKVAQLLEVKNKKIETLIRELHHRVKNNLQIVSSLLNLQYQRTADPSTKEAIREGQSRLEAMTLIHKNLYMHEDFSGINMKDYLDFLTKSLAISYGFPVEAVHTRVELKEPMFNLDQAIPLGLIVNELASNAFKYAFDGLPVDTVRLELELLETENKKVALHIKDNGKGLPANLIPEQSSSFGLRLVNTLSRQLDSTLTLTRDRGTSYQLEFDRK